jgi:hypothetical protein
VRAKYGVRALHRAAADLAPYRKQPRPASGGQRPAAEQRER